MSTFKPFSQFMPLFHSHCLVLSGPIPLLFTRHFHVLHRMAALTRSGTCGAFFKSPAIATGVSAADGSFGHFSTEDGKTFSVSSPPAFWRSDLLSKTVFPRLCLPPCSSLYSFLLLPVILSSALVHFPSFQEGVFLPRNSIDAALEDALSLLAFVFKSCVFSWPVITLLRLLLTVQLDTTLLLSPRLPSDSPSLSTDPLWMHIDHVSHHSFSMDIRDSQSGWPCRFEGRDSGFESNDNKASDDILHTLC